MTRPIDPKLRRALARGRRTSADTRAPSTPTYGMEWWDPATGETKVYTSPGVWIGVSGGGAEWDKVTGKPLVFPPAPHTHPDMGVQNLQDVTDLGSVTDKQIEAESFRKTGGLSSQFLKADGTIDSSSYIANYPAANTLQNVLAEGPFINGDKTKLDGIEALAEVNNISNANATDLTDGGDSTLHFHSTDRARANHTGTQLASTISDFDAEVSNNADVVANTAKVTNATHSGDVTGAFALTVAPTAISGKTNASSLTGAETVLLNQSGNLRKTTTQAIADLGGGGGSFVGFSATSADHTISAVTYTKIQFSTERYDIGSNFDTANNRFTAPTNGYYRFSVTMHFNPSNGGRKGLLFYVNGVKVFPELWSSSGWFAGNWLNSMTHTVDLALTAGQYVEVFGYSDTGTLSIWGAATVFSGSQIG